MMRSAAYALLCLPAIALAQTVPEESAWKDFTSWLEKQPPNSKPSDLIQSYRESLARKGVPAAEISRRMAIVSNGIFTRRKGVEVLWDKVYAGKNPIFIQSPSAVVRQAIEGRKPGKALDVGMG